MKPFLLMAGDNYYPNGETGDWLDCFGTHEEAQGKVSRFDDSEIIKSGKNKGQVVVTTHYEINGRMYDWYDIVDLNNWINKP